ncbi:MAG: hypothetical protein JW943_14225 [Deltaproteobacteria bacterium]|nr:hypothetical protein [Deltaproteobacteria bacterium]
MNDIDVKKVEGRKLMNEFILYPWTSGIYENDPAWIPPMIGELKKLFNRKKSYFFEIGEGDFFLAYRNGRAVGRITAHINRLYEDKYDGDTGFFGFYESINSQDVANALFDTAAAWLRKRGKTVIQGPQSFSVYDSVGFETEGCDITPIVGLLHFAPYYKDLAEAYGFTKCIDWSCYLVRDMEDYKPYLEQVKQEYMKGQDIEYKTLQKRDMKKRVREIHKIFNIAWDGNWGHLPLTQRQLDTLYDELKMVAIPELAIFAEDKGTTVGFCISIADANQALRILNGRLYPWRLPRALKAVKEAKKIRTIIMGVLPEYRGRKIDEVFYLKTIETGLAMGYNASDCSLVVETNHKMIGALKHLNAERYKNYRIYEKKIDAP